MDADAEGRATAPSQAAGRPAVNPWHRALVGVWGGALIVALAFAGASLVVGAPAARLGDDGPALAGALLGGAGWFLTVAVVAVVAQLAAAAASWRPPGH